MQMHLWQSDSWQPEWGREIVANYERCLISPHGAFCKGIKTAMVPAQATSQHAFHSHHAEWRARHTPEAIRQAKVDQAGAEGPQKSVHGTAPAAAPRSAAPASSEQSVSTAKSSRLLRAGAP